MKSTVQKASYQACRDFLIAEARLLDEFRLEEWLALFTDDGLYWIPIDETKPVENTISHVRDDALRREERVYHLLHIPFAAQSPRSRTVHIIANVQVEDDEESIIVKSNQVIHAFRPGDRRRIGLGQLTIVVAQVEHVLREVEDDLRIAKKTVLLIDREKPPSNLTFLI